MLRLESPGNNTLSYTGVRARVRGKTSVGDNGLQENRIYVALFRFALIGGQKYKECKL